MGALYLAWDPTLERQIAIKLLRDDSDELRERFSREAKFVARLRHPRIVTVFDVGEHDGQPFIAMEYVQGNTLADMVRAGAPLPVGASLRASKSSATDSALPTVLASSTGMSSQPT